MGSVPLHHLVNWQRRPPVFPRFFYAGNHAVDGDQVLIATLIQRLPLIKVSEAVQNYENTYLRLTGEHLYQQARDEANEELMAFVEEFGLSKSESESLIKTDKRMKSIFEKLEHVKQVARERKNKKSILGMVDSVKRKDYI